MGMLLLLLLLLLLLVRWWQVRLRLPWRVAEMRLRLR